MISQSSNWRAILVVPHDECKRRITPDGRAQPRRQGAAALPDAPRQGRGRHAARRRRPRALARRTGTARKPAHGRLLPRSGPAADADSLLSRTAHHGDLRVVLRRLRREPAATGDRQHLHGEPGGFALCRGRGGGSEAGVLVIGHNPGLHALALALGRRGPGPTFARLSTRFPTAALAIFETGIDSWAAFRAESARLVDFKIAKELS